MTLPVNPGVYTDFDGLTRLRADAQRQSPEAVRETARQFEALLMQMMIKSMREASIGDGGLLDNDQSNLYRDMYDKQLSLLMTQRKGLGLTEVLVRQLGGQPAAAAEGQAANREFTVPAFGAQSAVSPSAPLVHDAVPRYAAPRTVTPEERIWGGIDSNAVDGFDTPAAFVQSLWPGAAQAANDLGVAPEVLIAQAALETGWGQHVMQHRDGSSSYNLFGIKADSGWQGARVMQPTVEYENGIAVRRNAAFRAYGSFAESFQDYVNFLRDNPRYREALAQTDNPHAFAHALQRAGYATDPAYAHKIGRIMQSDSLREPLTGLKQAASEPLS